MTAAILRAVLVLALVLGWSASSSPLMAQETIQLPDPVKTGGMPLNAAMAARKSARSFKADALSDKQLSGIL